MTSRISVSKTLIFITIIWSTLLYLLSIHIKGPFVFGDEQVYFSFARTLSRRQNIDAYTQYGPLYPLLIAPFFSLKNIIQSYNFIKTFNIIIFISAVIPAYLLAKQVFKNYFLKILLPLLVLITPFGSFVYLIWAEPLYIPLFYWVCFLLYQHSQNPSLKNSLLLGIFISLLYLTKPAAGFIALPAIIATLCYHVLLNIKKKNIAAFATIVILTCFIGDFIWIMHYFKLGVSLVGYPTATREFNLKIAKIGHWRLSYDILRSIFYQFSYFFIGTWGLIGVFFTLFITKWRRLTTPEKNLSFFILAYICGLMVIVAIGMSSYSSLDHKITQGRYYSLVLPLIITLTLHFIFTYLSDKTFKNKLLFFILTITTLIAIIASPLYTRNPLAQISMPELTPFIYISDKGLPIARAMVEKPSLPLRIYSILFFTVFVCLLISMRKWKHAPLLVASIIFTGTLFNSLTQQYYILLFAKKPTGLNNVYRYLINQHIDIDQVVFDNKIEFYASFMTPFWMDSMPHLATPEKFKDSASFSYFISPEKISLNSVYSSKDMIIYRKSSA